MLGCNVSETRRVYCPGCKLWVLTHEPESASAEQPLPPLATDGYRASANFGTDVMHEPIEAESEPVEEGPLPRPRRSSRGVEDHTSSPAEIAAPPGDLPVRIRSTCRETQPLSSNDDPSRRGAAASVAEAAVLSKLQEVRLPDPIGRPLFPKILGMGVLCSKTPE